VVGASSLNLPTSVVSIWLEPGVITVISLRFGSNTSLASMMPRVAGRKSLSPFLRLSLRYTSGRSRRPELHALMMMCVTPTGSSHSCSAPTEMYERSSLAFLPVWTFNPSPFVPWVSRMSVRMRRSGFSMLCA
jgi:hypothetical protein